MPVFEFSGILWFAVSTLWTIQWTPYMKSTARREVCPAFRGVRQFSLVHHRDFGATACVQSYPPHQIPGTHTYTQSSTAMN